MNNYVADTMAIVLFLENRKLPNNIRTIFNEALQNKDTIYLSAVSLMEIGYLSEKQRIDITMNSVIELTKNNKNFIISPLNSDAIIEAFKINDIPELHDRLITATAVVLHAILITNDPVIRKSTFANTIWQKDN